ENFEQYAEEGETLYDVKKSFANKIKNLVSNEVLFLLPVIEVTPHFDTKDECYLYFTNTVVKITKDDISLIGYDELDGYVFKEQIIDKEFKLPTGSLSEQDIPFLIFLYNIAGNNLKRIKAFESVIGYMLHRYRNP